MRRIASLGLLLALAGCGQYVGSPFAGFGGFIADTHNISRSPNRPAGDSDNMRRVEGQPATSEPLVPEPGNVWPGPLPPDKTLADIERDTNGTLKPGEAMTLRNPDASQNGTGTVMVPNGNGTSTLIRPDGSVQTVPTPK
jgi:hypothetical protein